MSAGRDRQRRNADLVFEGVSRNPAELVSQADSDKRRQRYYIIARPLRTRAS